MAASDARRARDTAARRGAQGRPVARAPGVAALRGARRGCARTARHRSSRRSTSAGRWSSDLRASNADVAFVALHGRGGEDGTVQELLEIVGMPYTGSGVLGCMRCMDKVLTKHMLVEEGLPTPDFFAFSEIAFKELGAGEALPAIEERLGFPVVVKPAAQGSALGIKFARVGGRRPRGADRGVQLRRPRAARAPRRGTRAGGVAARGRGRGPRAAGGRGQAEAGVLLRLRGALRDRQDRLRLSRRHSRRRSRRRRRTWRCPCSGCSGATGSRAWT